MALNKNDLKEIEKIVKKTEIYLEDKIEFSISQSENRLEKRIDGLEDRIGGVENGMKSLESNLSRQITDFRKEMNKEIDSLSDMHQLAFKKIDKNAYAIKNHDIRIKRLEVKAVK